MVGGKQSTPRRNPILTAVEMSRGLEGAVDVQNRSHLRTDSTPILASGNTVHILLVSTLLSFDVQYHTSYLKLGSTLIRRNGQTVRRQGSSRYHASQV